MVALNVPSVTMYPDALNCSTSGVGAPRVVDSVSTLLPATGSNSLARAGALLARGPAAGAAICTVMSGAAPRASVGLVQVTTPALWPHVQPLADPQDPAPEAHRKPAPAGSVSVTTMLLAPLGPALRTVR